MRCALVVGVCYRADPELSLPEFEVDCTFSAANRWFVFLPLLTLLCIAVLHITLHPPQTWAIEARCNRVFSHAAQAPTNLLQSWRLQNVVTAAQTWWCSTAFCLVITLPALQLLPDAVQQAPSLNTGSTVAPQFLTAPPHPSADYRGEPHIFPPECSYKHAVSSLLGNFELSGAMLLDARTLVVCGRVPPAVTVSCRIHVECSV